MPIPPAPLPGALETKFTALPGEPIARDGRLKGYASLFDRPDQAGDVVAPGAFAASLAALRAAGSSVKLLWQHDPAQPIGVWEVVREDAAGLWVEGRLLPEIRRGAEALALIKAGAVDGLSIGYRATRAEPVAGGGRRLLEVELWEASIVTFPMLPGARAALPADHGAEPGADRSEVDRSEVDDLARALAEAFAAGA